MTDLPAPLLVSPASANGAALDGARWEPVALRRHQVDAAIDQLLSAARADEDVRRLLLVHPRAHGAGSGLAPGIQVSIEVLASGETACAPRRNSSGLALQIRGESTITINGETHTVGPRDLYSVPPFAIQTYAATGTEPSVRILYSNAALLETLGAHYVEPVGAAEPLPGAAATDLSVRNDGRVAPLGSDSWRLEYERVVDPPWVPMRSWVWRWEDVVAELDRMSTLGDRYNGRRVCVLYDPSTARTNGTSSTLFASMCIRPSKIIDRTHRHTAAAVNYFFEGSGWSTVDGNRIVWDAGDLVFIAPAWLSHHHASDDQPVYQLAVQDNPLHLAMGSLVWQEDLREPPRLLGAEPGFTTNRQSIEPTATP